MTHLDERKLVLTGREFSPYELAARDVALHAERINCPVFLGHGTGDTNVSFQTYTKALAEKLESLGKRVFVRYYEGREHGLEPAISKLEAFKVRHANKTIKTMTSRWKQGADPMRFADALCGLVQDANCRFANITKRGKVSLNVKSSFHRQ